MNDLGASIAAVVREEVAGALTETRYREPLVGFVDAGATRFEMLQDAVGPTHFLPVELLPGARSVISFFVPFSEAVVRANRRRGSDVAREWAVAYLETNGLINRIARRLISELAARGAEAAAEPATHNWDPETLVSRWSHKSVAAVAGLGTFGLHHMLITDAGCAGRFGSVVTSAKLEPTSRTEPRSAERCRYLHDGSCEVCVKRCPVGALSRAGLDKPRCHERLLEVAAGFQHLGLADVCGKCATGPCALQPGV